MNLRNVTLSLLVSFFSGCVDTPYFVKESNNTTQIYSQLDPNGKMVKGKLGDVVLKGYEYAAATTERWFQFDQSTTMFGGIGVGRKVFSKNTRIPVEARITVNGKLLLLGSIGCIVNCETNLRSISYVAADENGQIQNALYRTNALLSSDQVKEDGLVRFEPADAVSLRHLDSVKRECKSCETFGFRIVDITPTGLPVLEREAISGIRSRRDRFVFQPGARYLFSGFYLSLAEDNNGTFQFAIEKQP
ncbi:hypothetical protein HC024_02225 [Methylococcaceae bacterium WWC4]|nr:hypothetical protein [Methylococcaceae bacterium WWC4]